VAVLKYLRTGVLPIFYDRVRGHDHSKYLSVHAQARYFQIARLEEWVAKKQYVDAVKIYTYAREIIAESLYLATEHSSSEQILGFPFQTVEKRYICPMGIKAHMGSKTVDEMKCGKEFRQLMDDDDPEYEKVLVWQYLTVETTYNMPKGATT
jgi:hypothetical protein